MKSALTMTAILFFLLAAAPTDKDARDYVTAQKAAKLAKIKELEQQIVQLRKDITFLSNAKLPDVKAQMIEAECKEAPPVKDDPKPVLPQAMPQTVAPAFTKEAAVQLNQNILHGFENYFSEEKKRGVKIEIKCTSLALTKRNDLLNPNQVTVMYQITFTDGGPDWLVTGDFGIKDSKWVVISKYTTGNVSDTAMTNMANTGWWNVP